MILDLEFVENAFVEGYLHGASLFLTTCISLQNLLVINPQSCYYYGPIFNNGTKIEAPVTCWMKP